MTKRFSPKAGHYTALLAEVQRDIAKLKRNLAEMEARERSIKAFLVPFYEEGKFEVTADGKEFQVNFSQSTRSYLNQDRAKDMIINMGKKVPMFETNVVTFKVKRK